MPKNEEKTLTRNTFIITMVVTVGCVFIGGYINSCNDKNNKLREVKINYLLDAYSKLANASQRPAFDSSHNADVESAFSEIQLLGTKEQILIIDTILMNSQNHIVNGRYSLPIDQIINPLRISLRKELNLESVDGNINWIRLMGVPKQDAIPSTYPSNFLKGN